MSDDDASLGDSSHSAPSTSSACSTPIAPDDVVIQPRGMNLPPLVMPSNTPELSISIPSLETAKVGPQNFEKIRILGAGATGRVYLVKSVGLPTEGFYAMKVVKKSELVKRNRVQRILTEKQILSVANHPFVVTLHYSFQTPEHFYLIMQYCAGGEFFSFLRRQEKHRLSEAHAKFYAAEVLIALEYLHLLGIIYRDLKPENILVHESGHIMLSDFDLAHELKSPSKVAVSPTTSFTSVTGYSSSCSPCSQGGSQSPTASSMPSPAASGAPATPVAPHDNSLWFRVVDRKRSAAFAQQTRPSTPTALRSCLPFKCLCGSPITYPMVDTESHMELGEKRTSFVGTHEYVAPEIIAEEGYVGSVDWWAFGILLYEMIYGTTPFKGSTQIQTLENILDLSEDIEFLSDVDVSDDYKDLVRKLLDKTGSQRLQNPLQIKAHPFFQVIRHQKPPIVPDFVHTLKERQYSLAEIDAFDNEVPYAAGVSSPNTPRRKHSRASSSSASPTKAATAPPSAIRAPSSPLSTPKTVSSTTTSSSDRTIGHSVHMSDVLSSSISSGPGDAAEVAAVGASSDAPLAPQELSVSVPSFDYMGSPKRGYWSSAESSRTLHQKLSEMRLATPEEEEDEHTDAPSDQ